jgi:hypothetical protein
MKSIIFFLLATSCAITVSAQPVSVKDVQANFSGGDYRGVVQKTSRLFTSTTQDLQRSDEFAMLMLRGESQLQLKDRVGAMTTFKAAAKLADASAQYAAATANVLIIERSSMGRFTPRAGSSKDAVDILPIESRKKAMALLQAEIASQNRTQIDAALKATTLAPIEKVFKPLASMYCLEMEATGQATETGQLMRDIGQNTYRLIQTEVVKSSRRAEQLSLLANSVTGYNDWSATRRGLISTERDEMKELGEYVAKLRDRTAEYRSIAGRVGGDEQKWDTLVVQLTDTLAAIDSLIRDG